MLARKPVFSDLEIQRCDDLGIQNLIDHVYYFYELHP